MQVEVLFPALTGIILLPTSAFVYNVYRETGYRPLLVLALGLLFVAIESFLDSYEASRLLALAGGNWDKVPKDALNGLLALDAVRGVFIVLWASAEVAFTAMVAGTEKKFYTRTLPAIIAVVGIVETFAVNFSGIEPVHKRILLSSAGRVLGILVPVAIIAGAYLIAKVYREVGSKSVLAWGLGFLSHGLTLPLYPWAKEAGSAALGLWYLFGGIIPAALAGFGAYLLLQEAREAAGAEEVEEAV